MARKKVDVMNAAGVQIDPANEANQVLLRRLIRICEPGSTADQYQRQRVVVDSAVISSGTITTVGTLSAITTQPVNQIYEMMDRSRSAFAAGIRGNLSFG
jgi:hypothetical protein